MSGVLSELTKGAAVAAKAREGSFTSFLCAEVQTDKGTFSFRKHAVFQPIADLLGRIIQRREHGWVVSANKAAQIGFSTLTAALCGWACACQNVNVGYFLPDDRFAAEFDSTRVKPIEDRSPLLSSLRDRSTVGVARFGSNLRYTRGLFTAKGAISIPLDVLACDEIDFINKSNLETVVERLNASDLALQLYFCRGELPGAGIDLRFREGSQARWQVTCRHCGKSGQMLEFLFPGCVAQNAETGEWERVCIDCRKPYDVQADGEWVHAAPEMLAKKRASFSIPGLVVPQLPLAFVMQRWQDAQGKPSKMVKFKSSVLAIVEAGDRQPLSETTLGICAEDYKPALNRGDGRPRWMGVDMGDECWAWAEEETDEGRPRLVWAERIDSDNFLARIVELTSTLGVVAGIIDSKPLRDAARSVCYALPTIFAVQDFAGTESEPEVHDEEHWGKRYKRVTVGRDASLEEFVDQFAFAAPNRYIVPPLAGAPGGLGYAYIHLRNLTREQVEGADGKTRYAFAKQVENHLALAGNSARLARLLHRHKRFGGSGDMKMASAPRPSSFREQLDGFTARGRNFLRGWG
ncbi:MAG: phage terminase large subunit family protein [Myxococcales bacterium]|uniref:phage terminase large subunit family protein n=1 Tax=Sediminibacterium sp. TaxID=1917865 RepID=UPI001DEAFA61|nr:phage terminase large subunit family protein [Sediminibacterium sp.]MBT9485829.1 phage terminase large subunit family protein [Sediminibacterium sp.]MBT9556855.1 phage terminase large subunit family protein [Myxococcales bacterium]